MNKATVLSVGTHGGRLKGRDVARVTRSGDVRLRHAWKQNTDARAWDAIRRAARELARERVEAGFSEVWVYDFHGHPLDVFGEER